MSLRSLALLTLTLQNSLQTLLFSLARSQPGEAYHATTAVLFAEILKLIISLLFYAQERPKGLQSPGICADIFASGWYLLAVPAVLYTVQNNLQYIAITNLDAATFQVTYQLKILATALCSVWLLKRSLSNHKWFSLFILTIGIALVQLPAPSASKTALTTSKSTLSHNEISRTIGLVAVIMACFLSGLAGVYFERLLKTSKASLWVRNVQLSLFSLLPALIAVISVDGASVSQNGLLYGYSSWAYCAIVCQAAGGILVALVIKYADNILKGFATSISIILSSIASVYLFDFHISFIFVSGASLVMAATYIYGISDQSATLPASNKVVSFSDKPSVADQSSSMHTTHTTSASHNNRSPKNLDRPIMRAAPHPAEASLNEL